MIAPATRPPAMPKPTPQPRQPASAVVGASVATASVALVARASKVFRMIPFLPKATGLSAEREFRNGRPRPEQAGLRIANLSEICWKARANCLPRCEKPRTRAKLNAGSGWCHRVRDKPDKATLRTNLDASRAP